MEHNGNTYNGPVCLERLYELRAWHLVVGICPNCGRRAPIPQLRLAHGRAGLVTMYRLERLLRCSRCGHREGCRLLVYTLPRPNPERSINVL